MRHRFSKGWVGPTLLSFWVLFGALAVFSAVAVVDAPQAAAQEILGAYEDQDVVDMSLEMVDVRALDTGKYHAMVIQDPTDKRLIKGYFHLLLARPHSLSRQGGRGSGSSVWDDMKMIREEYKKW